MAIVPPLLTDVDNGIPMLMVTFGAMTFICCIVQGIYMKETKGKTPEQIADMFDNSRGSVAGMKEPFRQR